MGRKQQSEFVCGHVHGGYELPGPLPYLPVCSWRFGVLRRGGFHSIMAPKYVTAEPPALPDAAKAAVTKIESALKPCADKHKVKVRCSIYNKKLEEVWVTTNFGCARGLTALFCMSYMLDLLHVHVHEHVLAPAVWLVHLQRV